MQEHASGVWAWRTSSRTDRLTRRTCFSFLSIGSLCFLWWHGELTYTACVHVPQPSKDPTSPLSTHHISCKWHPYGVFAIIIYFFLKNCSVHRSDEHRSVCMTIKTFCFFVLIRNTLNFVTETFSFFWRFIWPLGERRLKTSWPWRWCQRETAANRFLTAFNYYLSPRMITFQPAALSLFPKYFLSSSQKTTGLPILVTRSMETRV